MIVQIRSNTPSWIFGLFLGLLALGLMQARTRRVRKIPAFLLPAGMIALLLAGIQSSFGWRAGPLAAWTGALALASLLGYSLFRDRRVAYDAAAHQFLVPGSGMPLAVIMGIFFAKYAYAVLRAIDAGAVSSPFFVAALSGIYGLLSGYFAARALNLAAIVRARSRP